ncbi:MAG: transposase [Erythrobacter sp.]|jgi:hypothetical protein|nr:transposase [Erythrobacter sp.]
MPPLIETSCDQPCALEEAIEGLAALGFDPQDGGNVAEVAGWLRRLTNNRAFLSKLLIDRLAGRLTGADVPSFDSGYGPQAIVLSPLRGTGRRQLFLRANIWPAKGDRWLEASGAASFVYGVPHDHNFSFLTSGYHGPGYVSDYYEYEYEEVAGYPGEPVDLRFTGRSALSQGRIMLYRAHRDVHAQFPPEALSVSLNVMHVDPAQGWLDQYGFDLERGEVARVLSASATEAFLRIAVAGGSEEALDYARWVGAHHPSERLRLASFEARAAQLDEAARDALWREAENCGSRLVAEAAKARRAESGG